MNRSFKARSEKMSTFCVAFSLVELVIIIAVVGILAAITVVGVGSWRTKAAETEVKSNLTGVQAGMEDARNQANGYPIFTEGTEFDGANDSKNIFVASEFVRIIYARGNASNYCIDVRSKAVSSVYLFLDTASGNTNPQVGTCDGGAGATPPTPQQTVFVFDTTAPGCTGTVQLPVTSPTSGGTVVWGDGSTEARTTSLMSHTYSTPGKYFATYEGPLTQASYYSSVNATNAKCLTRVTQWADNVAPTRINFYRASNLAYVATPPSSLTDMSYMFSLASSFNQPIGHWDTSNVTTMRNMFNGATVFNQPIGAWNTSKVTDMYGLFYSATAFNQPISSWNTSNATTMDSMFFYAVSFNQPIGGWNTAKVTRMYRTFAQATAFNQPIGAWDTSSVTSMYGMFNNAQSFNQNISGWSTANVTDMTSMFEGAAAFNQPVGGWTTTKVTNMRSMFSRASSFNQPLSAWDTSNVTDMRSMFSVNPVFNQPIGSWDTSKVTTINCMFNGTSAFNQPIGGWNTANVTDMGCAFSGASSFNQNISSWNVALVTVNYNFHTYSPLTQPNCPPSLW